MAIPAVSNGERGVHRDGGANCDPGLSQGRAPNRPASEAARTGCDSSQVKVPCVCKSPGGQDARGRETTSGSHGAVVLGMVGDPRLVVIACEAAGLGCREPGM